MNTPNVPVLILVRPGRNCTAKQTICADIPAVRVGDPAWVHEAAKAIALSITEHYESKEQA